MRAIERCRTAALGGRVYYCQDCDETLYRYHSCRNRHCPKCQLDKAQVWLEKQRDFLLPVPYFLLTFTLPAPFRRIARSHQKLVYNLLFRISAAASQLLAQDARFVGGQLGMMGVLHTWTRNLIYHPHVHYLLPAGGLAPDNQTWLAASRRFLFPVKALSRLFRAQFRQALQETELYSLIPSDVWWQEWVVHCKSVGDGRTALKYLAPYVFRVAISNQRILKLADGQVTFRYRDSDTGKSRLCSLSAMEFIRRFLQHVLPRGFVKVRYYGFFSSGLRPRLTALRQALQPASSHQPTSQQFDHPTVAAVQQAVPPVPSYQPICPGCDEPMHLEQIIRPQRQQPP